jgi:hypothetical protein
MKRPPLKPRAVLHHFQFLAALRVQGRHVIAVTGFGALQDHSFTHDFNGPKSKNSTKIAIVTKVARRALPNIRP